MKSIILELQNIENRNKKLCLRLYSESKKNGKFINEHSGLNQWNANGRKRNCNEIYIPFPSVDKTKRIGFFPSRDTLFTLLLTDGNTIFAKLCQDGGKAIMSNPNTLLGEWLLREILNINIGDIVTYDLLLEKGIDCVVFTKIKDGQYKIEPGAVGLYDEFYLEEEKNGI